MRKGREGVRGAERRVEGLPVVNPDVAGIDCGASTHYVAVPPDRDAHPVQSFPTFTGDLERLATWLHACGVRSVAMEATGVYWIPVYELLEARGVDVRLVNARHVKNVPGRKSDVSDCEWLRDLHSVGLLRGSFRPPAEIVALRGYVRHRQTLVELTSTLVLRMQKALQQMNLRLDRVVTDVTGQTGMAILRAIVAGERDPVRLAGHRDRRCHASAAEITAALTGHYRPEYLFVLQQTLGLYDMVQQQLVACDEAIATQLAALSADLPAPPPAPPGPPGRRPSELGADVATPLQRLTQTRPQDIAGLGTLSTLKIVAEVGTDMTRWRTAGHFTSWLSLAPRNKVSGGRLLSSRTQPSANRAAAVFRLAAMTQARARTALGAFYRRLAPRIGKAQAITATARKIAILFYRVMSGTLTYQDPGVAAYSAQQRRRIVGGLKRRAKEFGFALVNLETGEVLGADVS